MSIQGKIFVVQLIVAVVCGWLVFICLSTGNPLGLFPMLVMLTTLQSMLLLFDMEIKEKENERV